LGDYGNQDMGWHRDVHDAGDTFLKDDRLQGSVTWPENWSRVRVPSVERYLEALLLHWVRYKGTEKEMFYFFRLFDMCQIFHHYHGQHRLNRMERHCRYLMQSLLDHANDGDIMCYQSGIVTRDIHTQPEKVLHKRAAGPLRHDPYGHKYAKERLMPPRYPGGYPHFSTEAWE